MRSVGNTHRKSGALNQALTRITGPGPDDLVVRMGADTHIDPDLFCNAERHFGEEDHLEAVSSNHLVGEFHTRQLISLLRAMEYERDPRLHPRSVPRRNGRGALQEGAEKRTMQIPGSGEIGSAGMAGTFGLSMSPVGILRKITLVTLPRFVPRAEV